MAKLAERVSGTLLKTKSYRSVDTILSPVIGEYLFDSFAAKTGGATTNRRLTAQIMRELASKLEEDEG